MGENREPESGVQMAVSHSADAAVARREAKALAEAVGFGGRDVEEIVLAAGELATNLVKHAPGGTLSLSPVCEDGRAGIEIDSVDAGPGIEDVEEAVADGFSTAGSLGYGLGTVNRLMDGFDVTSPLAGGRGTRILCTRWLRREEPRPADPPLSFGVATRAYPGMAVNGDAFVIRRWGSSALAAVIDGVGHGPHAHRAAWSARRYVETHYDQPLKQIFQGVARNCRTTRGVVMAIARFDFGLQNGAAAAEEAPVGGIRLTFASVGNIEARVLKATERCSFIVRRGILGANAPDPVVTEHPWEPGSILLLFSDGLKTHWRPEEFPTIEQESASNIARLLVTKLGRDTDDATAVVVCGARP